MVGFVAAMGAELASGHDVFPRSQTAGCPDAEMWNVRIAMLGLVALAFTEYVKEGALKCDATLINKHRKTPYEMVKKKKPNLKYFHVFGCKCFVLKTHPEQLSKFDLKADEGIFVGYPLSTKAFRVYNLRKKLRFENEDVNSNSVNSDDLNPDPVSSDELNSDVIETVVTAPRANAPVQGEQVDDHTIS
ncbi:hypothetical protein AgCh_000523 [Apium graveolens]